MFGEEDGGAVVVSCFLVLATPGGRGGRTWCGKRGESSAGRRRWLFI